MVLVKDKDILVVSAHAADYVWRSGGTIAKYIESGARVHVVVLSDGVRGESNDLWKQENATAEGVAAIRRNESRKAAEILGLKTLDFWGMQDYPLSFGQEEQARMVRLIRTLHPDVIITHDVNDILNMDHNRTHTFVWQCSIMANSAGVLTEGLSCTRQMKLFGFEPHQTEISGYRPEIFIDITSAYEKKARAMECFAAQKHLIEYYKQRASMRGNHARRLSGNSAILYAESFSRKYPVVAQEFV